MIGSDKKKGKGGKWKRGEVREAKGKNREEDILSPSLKNEERGEKRREWKKTERKDVTKDGYPLRL